MSDKKLQKKVLCKWSKKDIEDHLDILAVLVGKPRFICRKCGRAANCQDALCKAVRIEGTS